MGVVDSTASGISLGGEQNVIEYNSSSFGSHVFCVFLGFEADCGGVVLGLGGNSGRASIHTYAYRQVCPPPPNPTSRTQRKEAPRLGPRGISNGSHSALAPISQPRV